MELRGNITFWMIYNDLFRYFENKYGFNYFSKLYWK
jgi:hypothetical protein